MMKTIWLLSSVEVFFCKQTTNHLSTPCLYVAKWLNHSLVAVHFTLVSSLWQCKYCMSSLLLSKLECLIPANSLLLHKDMACTWLLCICMRPHYALWLTWCLAFAQSSPSAFHLSPTMTCLAQVTWMRQITESKNAESTELAWTRAMRLEIAIQTHTDRYIHALVIEER